MAAANAKEAALNASKEDIQGQLAAALKESESRLQRATKQEEAAQREKTRADGLVAAAAAKNAEVAGEKSADLAKLTVLYNQLKDVIKNQLINTYQQLIHKRTGKPYIWNEEYINEQLSIVGAELTKLKVLEGEAVSAAIIPIKTALNRIQAEEKEAYALAADTYTTDPVDLLSGGRRRHRTYRKKNNKYKKVKQTKRKHPKRKTLKKRK